MPKYNNILIVKLYEELNDLDHEKSVDQDRLQDFPRDDDSIIIVRERQIKLKPTGCFKEKKGTLRADKVERTKKFCQKEKCPHTKH